MTDIIRCFAAGVGSDGQLIQNAVGMRLVWNQCKNVSINFGSVEINSPSQLQGKCPVGAKVGMLYWSSSEQWCRSPSRRGGAMSNFTRFVRRSGNAQEKRSPEDSYRRRA